MPKISYQMQPEGTVALRTVALGDIGDSVNILIAATPNGDDVDSEDFDIDVDIHSAAPPEATAEMLELAARGLRAALAAETSEDTTDG
jgi:hypothetical protein